MTASMVARWMTIAAALALGGCGGEAPRERAPAGRPAITVMAEPAAEAPGPSEDELLASLANDRSCRCALGPEDFSAPPTVRHGQLELRLNPNTVLSISFPSSGEEALRVTALMLVVAYDLSDGVPKVRALRLLGAPAAIRDTAGETMVIAPRIALGIGEAGILSIDIDPSGQIRRIPGT